MFREIFVASAVLFCVRIQFAAPLDCLTCYEEADCLSPRTVHCTQEKADDTREILKIYLGQTPRVFGNNFNCLDVDFENDKGKKINVRGCIHREEGTCRLTEMLNPFHVRTCYQCSKDGCNVAQKLWPNMFALLATFVGSKILRCLVSNMNL